MARLEFGDPDEPERRIRSVTPPVDDAVAAMRPLSKRELKLEIEASEAGKPVARSKAAVAMKLRGFTYQHIAEHLGYASPKDAQSAAIATIASTYNPEDNKTLRAVQSARLDRLLLSVYTRATDPTNADHLAYNRRASEIVQDISRLHGVNAPTQLQLTNPSADKIEELVTHLQQLQSGELPEEGDILAFEEDEEGTFTGENGTEGAENVTGGDEPEVYSDNPVTDSDNPGGEPDDADI